MAKNNCPSTSQRAAVKAGWGQLDSNRRVENALKESQNPLKCGVVPKAMRGEPAAADDVAFESRCKYLERTLKIIADYEIKPTTNRDEALSLLIAVAKTAIHRQFGPETESDVGPDDAD